VSGYGATWREAVGPIGDRVTDIASSDRLVAVVARRALIAIAFYLIVRWYFALTLKSTIDGLALGSLYGVVGVALVLTYRTSRIINFAAAAVGAVPAITAVLLSTAHHVNYLLTMPIALVGGAFVGAGTELFVLRRFKKASRLIVTVVSIGIAQSYAALGFFIPVWFGERASAVPKVTTPWQNLQYHSSRGEPIITGNQIFAFVVVLVLTFALMYFLKRTKLGIALRAASENGERAELLGIPVNQVNMAAWAFAGLLSAAAIFAQAPIIGVPSDATLGFDTLLYGLAAAVVAKFDNIGLALLTGLGVGLLIAGSVVKSGDYSYSNGMMLVIILLGMLAQRRSRSRAVDQNASSWQTVANFRPIPVELRRLPEVVRAKVVGIGAVLLLAIVLPYIVNGVYIYQLQLLPIYGIVGVSLVVLTGWAGQISLGQFGLVGISAGVVGGVVARHNPDFFAALAIGIAVGAVAAVIIGLPALRFQGLYLAVTTLAFGYATQFYFLNINYWFGSHVLPASAASTIRRPVLYGRLAMDDTVTGQRTFYFVCLALLLLSMLASMSFRRQHSGRVLIALRDNQRAASSYTVSPVKTRLAAFAIAGALCGIAGTLIVYDQHRVTPQAFSTPQSIGIFLACAVGGLSSLSAGVVGAVSYEAFVLFGQHLYGGLGQTWIAVIPLLLTGPLLIVNLYQNPGGLAGWAFDIRDNWLRRLAQRRKIHVPALVADRLVEPGPTVDEVEHSMPEPELVK
jgi:branched-chain amino acid transport system permease protein